MTRRTKTVTVISLPFSPVDSLGKDAYAVLCAFNYSRLPARFNTPPLPCHLYRLMIVFLLVGDPWHLDVMSTLLASSVPSPPWGLIMHVATNRFANYVWRGGLWFGGFTTTCD